MKIIVLDNNKQQGEKLIELFQAKLPEKQMEGTVIDQPEIVTQNLKEQLENLQTGMEEYYMFVNVDQSLEADKENTTYPFFQYYIKNALEPAKIRDHICYYTVGSVNYMQEMYDFPILEEVKAQQDQPILWIDINSLSKDGKYANSYAKAIEQLEGKVNKTIPQLIKKKRKRNVRKR